MKATIAAKNLELKAREMKKPIMSIALMTIFSIVSVTLYADDNTKSPECKQAVKTFGRTATATAVASAACNLIPATTPATATAKAVACVATAVGVVKTTKAAAEVGKKCGPTQ